MKNILQINPLLRAFMVIGLVAALVSGVTYAAIQSQATLTSNTVSSATASLGVSKTLSNFASSKAGFDFSEVVPGGAASEENKFFLQNSGTADLNISATVPTTLPLTYTDSIGDPVVVDESKVFVSISCTSIGGVVFDIDADLATLGASDVAAVGDSIPADSAVTCFVSVSMDADAFTADSANSSGFDLEFTGTGV